MQNKERMYEKCILSFFLFVNFLEYFFFAYIHPYMDGNGRTARFTLNLMLVTITHDIFLKELPYCHRCN